MEKILSYPKNKIKILLLEEVHEAAVSRLKDAGYNVTEIRRSLDSNELMEQISDVHIIGVRSKTKISGDHLRHANKLLAIGCFGVGTTQVDLDRATSNGVVVFNAPYGNTRSVAELTIGLVIMLARKAADKNSKMHKGLWDKGTKGCVEVRGKTLGIVGLGHIGQQVAVLAQALGMNVLFFDKIKKLAIGNAKEVDSLREVLEQADFVSLHIPGQQKKEPVIREAELSQMKKGSYLLNLSRGDLIDLGALRKAIIENHLAGAAVDAFPNEPKTNKEAFKCDLTELENVVLTPHIGGSTEEAQYNIGTEVASAFIKFIDGGSTVGAVNFPQVSLPLFPESHRILNIHRNVPGVLMDVNKIISDVGVNVDSQYLSTYKDVGYLIMDINKELSEDVKCKIAALPTNIKTRILY